MARSKEKPTITTPHPGGFVRATIIEPLGLSVKEAAQALGVHRVALSRFLNEQAGLSAEMAIRLQKAFGANMVELMRMQNDFDIARAREHEHEIEVSRYVPADAQLLTQPRLF
ncbi:addiction module antidote protein, HigA family [Paracoccus solventivorans]|uniref:Addiction module antidote protein, HigA family n=1 Tax=Paracoccus solventivorans TaxID=53463 RepID=A0A1M7JV26_9RHOB|nr:HigA family addiction module antitoxin [Paracoccus solventivorans]SHM56889.1 addiction module antidote protein, HigA family [Paracoccus solventivorans]